MKMLVIAAALCAVLAGCSEEKPVHQQRKAAEREYSWGVQAQLVPEGMISVDRQQRELTEAEIREDTARRVLASKIDLYKPPFPMLYDDDCKPMEGFFIVSQGPEAYSQEKARAKLAENLKKLAAVQAWHAGLKDPATKAAYKEPIRDLEESLKHLILQVEFQEACPAKAKRAQEQRAQWQRQARNMPAPPI